MKTLDVGRYLLQRILRAQSRKFLVRIEIGCFIAVLTSTLNLFGSLDFLGSIYTMSRVIMQDLGNFSKLLAEKDPDLVDTGDAINSPRYNVSELDIAVEFDSVNITYPT